MSEGDAWRFPWPESRIEHYTAHRASRPPSIDGRLDDACWRSAPRSPRFVDLVTGARTALDTTTAVLWDDDHLYVGYWIEQPHVTATLTERDAPIWHDDDVELFVAGADAYYEFEINAFGTIYEVLFVWDEAYERGPYAAAPELRRDHPRAEPFDGVGFTGHPRGGRTGFWGWDLPGLRSAVSVDGTINDDTDRDRGWTVELALPWDGLRMLAEADGRAVPPVDGDTWRMDFSRFNTTRHGDGDSGGWAMSAHGVWDSHVPELFAYVHFSDEVV